MPPPVEDTSDEEAGDIPFNTAKDDTPESTSGVKKDQSEDGKNDVKKANGDDSSEDEEDEEGVYVVESILTHDFLKGTLLLHVKWKGYDKVEDMTWEPEENLLDGAHDILAAYYKKIGGRPQKPSPQTPAKAGPGRKRKSMGESKVAPVEAPKSETKRRRKSAAQTQASETPALTEDNSENEDQTDWVPAGKNWDKELDAVDTIVRDPESQGLFVLLVWKNGKKSRVSIETCYEKCPQKMLKFYESHLVFKDT
ncbi:uncharacterized protein N7484_004357 [Penicillium longicatenatum]|uniref:uncharacterized protein n=1 Tax=Penicillium longicatenatum TaxID=1561947 RepID=UPI00254714F9|nr:uncharacterized protein N7484_004357 [Penicillium longicatenatum]KAJ5650634.1 hypothetical protein N7484_004357 [Penicillium longicatenatum]